jgi:hypothetical protein
MTQKRLIYAIWNQQSEISLNQGKYYASEWLPWVHVAIRQSEEISARDVLKCQTSVLTGLSE